MSIVCGTDFSDAADQALRAAAALARRKGLDLHVVHALGVPASGKLTPGTWDSFERAAVERLERAAVELSTGGLPVRHALLHGAPDEAILDYAHERSAELVVVSSLGRRAHGRWLLGSVADRLAQTADLPVLVARDGAAFEAWGRGERPLRVLLGLDPSEPSDHAAAWAGALARVAPCELAAVHLYWERESGTRAGQGALDRDPSESHARKERELEADLRERLAGVPGAEGMRLRLVPTADRPAEHLVRIAREQRADLLVVGTHQRMGLQRLWHGSVSHDVLMAAETNVACVPAREQVTPAATGAPPRLPARSVLCPTDLSELGSRGVAYGAALLADDGVLHVLHVLEPHGLPNPLYAHYSPGSADDSEEQARRRQDAERRLEALVPPEVRARGLKVRIELLESPSAATAIAETAERLGVDLVCLPTHGRTGARRLLAGSVAEEVMARLKRPLLLVRP